MVWFFQLLLRYARKIMSTVENGNVTADQSSTEPDEDSNAISKQAHLRTDTDTTLNSEKVIVIEDDECQVRVESKTSDTISNTGSHSSASSCHSTHGSRDNHSRITPSTPARDWHGRSSNSVEQLVNVSGGSSAGSGIGGSGLGLGEFDVLRFRNCFLQTVEELKMRRDVDVKKENRIKELVEGKHQLQQKCDDIEHAYTEHLEQFSHQEQDIRKQFTNQIRQYEEDKARQVCMEESRLKEVKALKDEIRALQLAKYNVEKKVEEQERQLQVQILSQESILSEMNGVESKYQIAMSQVASTTDQMSQLEANVKQAIEMNRKLQYVNEHQKCLLAGYKTELESCRQQLVETRVSLADALAERGERDEQTSRKTTTEQELKMHTELNKQLQLQLSGLREEHQAVLGRLKEAHSLLEKHVETSNRAQESEHMLKEEIEKLQKRNEGLEVNLSALQDQLTSQKQELSTGIEHWKTKAAEVEQRLKSLQGDYSSLQEAHDQLEAKGVARESELTSEIARLVETEQQRKEEGRDEEGTKQRISELEEALRQSETHAQEKNVLLEDKEVQTMSTASQESPPTSHCKLKSRQDSVISPTTRLSTIRQSPVNPLPITLATTDTEAVRMNHSGSIQMCATECMESNTGSGGTGVPSPPKSSLSPEVISESNTTSSEDKITAPLTADESFKPSLKLTSPRLHLERIHLPGKGPQNGSSNNLTFEQVKSSQETSVPVSTSKDTSPLKRKSNECKFPTVSDENMPTKKQKLHTVSKDVLPTSKTLLQLGRSNTTSTNTPQNSQSQPERTPEKYLFHPLSQPNSCVERVNEEENQSLSQPSDSMSRKDTTPWRIDIPKSFYANKKLKTTNISPAKSMDSKSLEPPASMLLSRNSSKQSVCSQVQVHLTFPEHLPIHYKIPWRASEPEYADKVTNSLVMKSASVVSTGPSPMPANTTAHTNTELSPKTQGTNPPSMCSSEHSESKLEPHKGSHADQSVPNSPGGSSNFAIVFSEGEDEGHEGGDKDLLSSQMVRQIKKVKTFLKNDRLRITKAPKV